MTTRQEHSNQNLLPTTRRTFLKAVGAAGATTLLTPLYGASATSKKLRYWTWMKSTDNNPRAKSQGMILDAFRKANPDIELIEEYIPWDQLRQQMLQAAFAGTAPDVSRQVDQYVGVLAQAGAVLPLDEFIKSWSDDRRKDYLYAWEDTVWDGKKFAFRQAVRPGNMLYYRTDLIPQAPKTWDEFHKAIVAATKGQIMGWVEPYSKADNVAQVMQQVPPMLWALGGDLVDAATGKPRFHEDAGVKVIQWLQDLIHKYKVMPPGVVTMNADAADTQFLGGVAASIFQNNAKWGQWSTRDAIKGKIATAPFPNFSNDASKPGSPNLGGGWTLVMGKGARKEEAWKLIEFMQSPEAELLDAKVGGETPTRKSSLKDPWFKNDEAARMRDHLAWLAASPHPATTMRIKDMGQFTDIFGDALQEIMSKQADVKKTLADAAAKYTAIL